jgi:hypothetical protein
MDPKTRDSGFDEPETVGTFRGRGSADLIINTDFYRRNLSGLTLAAMKVYLGLLCLKEERGLRESFEMTSQDIANCSGVSLRSVPTALKRLEEEELLGRMEMKNRDGGNGHSNFIIVSPKNPITISPASFAPPLPADPEKSTTIGMAQDLQFTVSTIGKEDLSDQEDSLGLPSRKIPAEKAQGEGCGVAGTTNQDGVNTGSRPRAEKVVARAKMRPNQRLVSCIWEIYDEMEVKRPSPATIGKWRRMYDGKFVLQVVDDLAGAGHLEKGLGYVFAVLKRRWKNYSTTKNPLDDPFSPARDGIKWGDYRWSSILGTNVKKDFWVSMVKASEMDIKAMKANSIPRPDPTPWEAVGDFSEED